MKKTISGAALLTFICACGPTANVVRNDNSDINIGYTTVSRNAMSDTSNSLQISDSDHEQYNSMLEYLRDRVPGVEVQGSSIIIRGISSLQGASDPLIMFDGAEIMDINMVDPRDVYSVDVLKDTGASMYGVKGSNGVILIKSKTSHIMEVQAREAKKAARAIRKKK